MAALFNNISEKFALQARAGNIEIRVEAPDRPIITGDIDQLAQVFSNLVENALKFTPSRVILHFGQRNLVPGFRWKWQIPARGFHPRLCFISSPGFIRTILPGLAARNMALVWGWPLSKRY
jgi:signal transduction histidine kinase